MVGPPPTQFGCLVNPLADNLKSLEDSMKIRIWLLLAVVAFCLLTAIRQASARNAQVPQPDRTRINGIPSHSGHAVESAPGHGNRTYSAGQERRNPVASNDPVALSSRASRPQGNRQGQVADDQDNGTEANLTPSEQCDPPLEWQMTRPDSQRANSFIHSKSKPPP
jgi:hypothetical protein